jgi:hypothetical protein
MSYLDAVFNSILEDMQSIQLSRDYFNGKQNTSFITTDRMKAILSLHTTNTFRLNVCQTVVQALANELNLTGFDTDEIEGADGVKEQASFADEVYKANKLDTLQDDVHESALSDRESFVVVEWDAELGRVVLTHNPRLILNEAGGDDMGIVIMYENDDITQKPLYAIKQWKYIRWDDSGLPHTTQRRSVYYSDRIERFYKTINDPAWQKFVEEDPETGIEKPWPSPWVDGKGEPLGIPVVHFSNKAYTSEHWEAIPPQDIFNKTVVDIVAANDITAFKSFFGFGFYPTTDGKVPKSDGTNLMKIGPGQFNGTTKTPTEASLQIIEGADNTPLVNWAVQTIMFIAQITDTPVTKFITSAQIASAETIMAQKQALRDKATDRRGRFGDKWAQCMVIARRLTNFFGGTDYDETVSFKPIWKSDKTVEEVVEKLDRLEITHEQAWRESGYSTVEIAEMRASLEYRMKFERELWEGYDVVSQHGITLEMYLRRIGMPESEITELVAAQGKATPAISQ